MVLVPLEDGDRCEALIGMGKKVITIDLNPLSRTAKTATLTICDELTRALPNITAAVKELKGDKAAADELIRNHDNAKLLNAAVTAIMENLSDALDRKV